jgi:hypothetical protein
MRSLLDNNGNDNDNDDGDDEKGMMLVGIPAIVRSPLWILLCVVMQSSVRYDTVPFSRVQCCGRLDHRDDTTWQLAESKIRSSKDTLFKKGIDKSIYAIHGWKKMPIFI